MRLIHNCFSDQCDAAIAAADEQSMKFTFSQTCEVCEKVRLKKCAAFQRGDPVDKISG